MKEAAEGRLLRVCSQKQPKQASMCMQMGDEREPGIMVAALASPEPQPCISGSSQKTATYSTTTGAARFHSALLAHRCAATAVCSHMAAFYLETGVAKNVRMAKQI